MSQLNQTQNSSFREGQTLLENSQPLVMVSKDIYSFIKTFGSKADHQKYDSEDRVYFIVLLELFKRLEKIITEDEVKTVTLFIENKDEIDRLVKIAYILDQYSAFYPRLIRELALDLPFWLSLEEQIDTDPLCQNLTVFANEFQSAQEVLNKA